MKNPRAVLKLVRIGKPYFSPIWFTSPVQNSDTHYAVSYGNIIPKLHEENFHKTSGMSTCNVVNYLSVSSAGDVEELVDVGPHGITLLCAHVQAAFQICGVTVYHCLDLLENHVKSETGNINPEF